MNNIAEQNVSGLRAVHKNPPCPVSPTLRVSHSPYPKAPGISRPVAPSRRLYESTQSVTPACF